MHIRDDVDYYAVLGVARTASLAEIKRAYRTIAREHHPDTNLSTDGGTLSAASIAYETLSDPARRRNHDVLLDQRERDEARRRNAERERVRQEAEARAHEQRQYAGAGYTSASSSYDQSWSQARTHGNASPNRQAPRRPRGPQEVLRHDLTSLIDWLRRNPFLAIILGLCFIVITFGSELDGVWTFIGTTHRSHGETSMVPLIVVSIIVALFIGLELHAQYRSWVRRGRPIPPSYDVPTLLRFAARRMVNAGGTPARIWPLPVIMVCAIIIVHLGF